MPQVVQVPVCTTGGVHIRRMASQGFDSSGRSSIRSASRMMTESIGCDRRRAQAAEPTAHFLPADFGNLSTGEVQQELVLCPGDN